MPSVKRWRSKRNRPAEPATPQDIRSETGDDGQQTINDDGIRSAKGMFSRKGTPPAGKATNIMAKNKSTGKHRIDNETIIALLTESGYSPMTAGEIAARFELRGGAVQSLRRLLRKMTLNGEIVQIRHNRYTLGSPADLVTGRLRVSRSKTGFLETAESDFRIRIAPQDQGTALPGDTVSVRLDSEPAGKHREDDRTRTGKVIRVLERAQRWIVGTLRSTGRFWYVVPIDPVYDKDFYVTPHPEAKVDDRVVIKFANWANRHVNPEAEIVEVIGPADSPSTDTLAIIRHYDLPDEFPENVMRDAETAANRQKQPGRRLDFRKPFVFTVDPATARDFDDALSLERDPQGRRILGVHIADVSHFVRPGSALDEEAYRRGNSVYLPDRVLPMLPEQLSNGLCSLRPNEDRFAFSVWITVDDHGTPLHWRFGRTVIRSRARLTYEQALDLLQTRQDPGAVSPGLTAGDVEIIRETHRLAQQFRGRRFAANALDIEVPEWDVRIDRNGLISQILPRVHDVSHQLVEECMIAANEAVDTELSRRGVPLLHRVHEAPSEVRLQELATNLADLGLHPGDLRNRRNLVQLLRDVQDHPLKRHVHLEVLKSMKRAEYAAEAGGHFGLAKKFYTHFTSPIRRYPDLVVHRILAANLHGRGGTPRIPQLKASAAHCSATERNAEEAERALIEIKKFRYLQQATTIQPPPVFTAHVVHVVNFGMFVELEELQIQGLVHISEISPEFVRFDGARQALLARNKRYEIGMKLTVQVARVDFDKRQVDFLPVDPNTTPADGSQKQRAPKQRRRRSQRSRAPRRR